MVLASGWSALLSRNSPPAPVLLCLVYSLGGRTLVFVLDNSVNTRPTPIIISTNNSASNMDVFLYKQLSGSMF